MRDVIRVIQQTLTETFEAVKRRREEAQVADNVPAMGALYEDVEKFFGDIFAFYGRFLARYPIVFILVSLLSCCLLGMGLINVKYEKNVERLYTPMGSPAFKDRARLADVFPDSTREAYYPYQLIYHGTYGEVMFIAPDGENILEKRHVAEIERLRDQLLEITLDDSQSGLHYDSVCARRHGKCVISGDELLRAIDTDGCYNRSRGYPYMTQAGGFKTDLRDVLSDEESSRLTDNGYTYDDEEIVKDDCITSKVLRLRFNLRHDTPQQRTLSLLWEKQFLSVMSELTTVHLDVAYSVSESLDIELAEHLGKDTKFFSLTIVIMVLYATFVSSGGDWVSTRVLLAQAGIVAALLAILASFGFLSMCGMLFVDICGVMPFLILGVGVDDMFILMSGWRQTDLKRSIEDRMSDTFRSSAISVTITSLTDLLAFCIGATSPFLAVRNFCIYAGVAVLFCYLNHLTFFAGCMVLHERRVRASRHCVTCMRTKSRKFLEEDGLSRSEVLCCHGNPPKQMGEDDSLCEKIPNTALPRLLLQWPVKMLIILLFVVYLGVSIWGAARIKTGLKLEHVVPETSYLSKYLLSQRQYFIHNGPPIMFVITDPISYQDSEARDKMKDMLKRSKQSGCIDEQFQISWVDQYFDSSYVPQGGISFVQDLQTNFLKEYPQYVTDIKFNDDNDIIMASRIYIRSKHLNNSTAEGDMMTDIREIAINSSLPVIAYSPEFIFYEHYVSILKNTLLSVGVAVIGMIFIALMFIPHPISITCVTITMVTIVLGMFGCMYYWDLELSAITNVQIILSVGFCVDFTVHISHAFMTATGKNRNERVVAALEKVGIPILNGAFSSILGVLILAFAHSYVFRSFFKTMLLVISLGIAHSLLLLPVMLSFIGPRRTSKPRVFIPISNNWSSPVGILGLGGSRRHASEHVEDLPGDPGPSPDPPPPSEETSRENLDIELMNLESPDERRQLLDGAEGDQDRLGKPSASRRLRTLLDKTPDEEHYRQPIHFTEVQIMEDSPVSPSSNRQPVNELTPEKQPQSPSCRQVKGTGPQEVSEDGGDSANGGIDPRAEGSGGSQGRDSDI